MNGRLASDPSPEPPCLIRMIEIHALWRETGRSGVCLPFIETLLLGGRGHFASLPGAEVSGPRLDRPIDEEKNMDPRTDRPSHDAAPKRRWPMALLLCLTAAGWLAFGVNNLLTGRMPASAAAGIGAAVPSRAVTPRGNLAADELSTIDLYTRSSPSVVHITTSVEQRDFFSMNLFEIPQGTGSGFVWDDKGHIVTNFHVIRSANRAVVTLGDHTEYPARLVGTAPSRDLAVLQIDAPPAKLVPLEIGSSGDLRVGQKVFAIGNPFGFDQTLTTGIISGLGRELDEPEGATIKDLIQTDAAINPGNSGGPLLDSAGLLIGLNTAIYSPSGAYAGIGLAIPVDEVNRTVPQLIAYGKIIRPGLGISMVSDRIARQWGIQGILIDQAPPESAAGRAGLRSSVVDAYGRVTLGDVIVKIDDQDIQGVADLYSALDSHAVGDVVKVTVMRGNTTEDIDVTLQQIN